MNCGDSFCPAREAEYVFLYIHPDSREIFEKYLCATCVVEWAKWAISEPGFESLAERI